MRIGLFCACNVTVQSLPSTHDSVWDSKGHCSRYGSVWDSKGHCSRHGSLRDKKGSSSREQGQHGWQH